MPGYFAQVSFFRCSAGICGRNCLCSFCGGSGICADGAGNRDGDPGKRQRCSKKSRQCYKGYDYFFLIFEEIEKGNLKLDDTVITSAHAKSMGGSQVFLEEGETQTVETMIKCIVIASGNDASVAMAEHIAGNEPEFVNAMNKKAQALGMKNTHFCGLLRADRF